MFRCALVYYSRDTITIWNFRTACFVVFDDLSLHLNVLIWGISCYLSAGQQRQTQLSNHLKSQSDWLTNWFKAFFVRKTKSLLGNPYIPSLVDRWGHKLLVLKSKLSCSQFWLCHVYLIHDSSPHLCNLLCTNTGYFYFHQFPFMKNNFVHEDQNIFVCSLKHVYLYIT